MSHHIILFLNCVRLWSFSHRLETKVRERKKAIMLKEKKETLSSDLNVTFFFMCNKRSSQDRKISCQSASAPVGTVQFESSDVFLCQLVKRQKIHMRQFSLINEYEVLPKCVSILHGIRLCFTNPREEIHGCGCVLECDEPEAAKIWDCGHWRVGSFFFFFFPSEPEIVYVCAHTCS